MRITTTQFETLLNDALHQNTLIFPDQARIVSSLATYLAAMQKWNTVYNLTAITKPIDMVRLHIIDSLLISRFLTRSRYIDIGSGAGLPGLPLALCHPSQDWTLLDKNSKKTRFLFQMVSDLGLSNVTVIHSRVEEYRPATLFDGILSRAYTSLAQMIDSTQHLLNQDGRFFAMKGQRPDDEMMQCHSPFIIDACHRLTINGLPVERHLIDIKRATTTT